MNPNLEFKQIEDELSSDKDPTEPTIDKLRCYIQAASAFAKKSLADNNKEQQKTEEEINEETKLLSLQKNYMLSYVRYILRKDVSDAIRPKVINILKDMLQYVIDWLPFDEHSVLIILPFIFMDAKFYNPKNLNNSNVEIDSTFEFAALSKYNHYSPYITDVINFFGQKNGFQEILNRINREDKKVDVKTILYYLKFLDQIKKILKTSFFEKYVLELKDAIFSLILNYNAEELKAIPKVALIQLTEYLNSLLLVVVSTEKAGEFTEKFQLDIALKCVQSSSLEKRLQGLQGITSLITMANLKNQKQSMNFYSSQKSSMMISPTKWLTVDYLIDWLIENKIIEDLLGAKMHHELLKRSNDIFKLFAAKSKLELSHLDMLWNASLGKQEVTTVAIYSIIRDLLPYFTKEFFDKFNAQVGEIKIKDYDLNLVNLIQACADISINKSADDDFRIYQLKEFLWKACLDENEVSQEVLQASLQAIKTALIKSLGRGKDVKVIFLRMCTACYQTKTSIPQALSLLQSIIELYYKSSSSADSRQKVMDFVLHDQKMANLFFEEYIHYMDEVWKRVSFDNTPDTINNFMIGHYSHLDHIQKRLEFLSFILKYSQFQPSQILIETLWNATVAKTLTAQTNQLFFLWLASCCKENFSSSLVEYIFVEKLLKLDPSTVSLDTFNCFQSYFLNVNISAHKIVTAKFDEFYVTNHKLIGLDELWDIVLTVNDPQVTLPGMTYLASLYHSRLSPQLLSQAGSFHELFIKTSMSKLAKASSLDLSIGVDKAEFRIERCITLLEQFIAESKLKPKSKQTVTLKLKVSGQGSNFDVSIPNTEKLSELRDRLAKRYGLNKDSPNAIQINFSELPKLCDSDYYLPMQDLGVEESMKITFDIVPKKDFPETSAFVNADPLSPSLLLSNNSEYFAQLFGLLDSNEVISEKVWKLLSDLPFNPEMKNRLINVDEKTNWEEFIVTTSPFKLLYSLNIIDSIISDSTNTQTGAAWYEKFIQSDGVKLIFNIFLHQNEYLTGRLKKRCIESVLKLVNGFMITEKEREPEKEFPNPGQIQTKAQAMAYAEAVAKAHAEAEARKQEIKQYVLKENLDWVDYPNLIQSLIASIEESARDTESEPNSIDGSIVRHAGSLLLGCFYSKPDLLQTLFTYPNLDSFLHSVTLLTSVPLIREVMTGGILYLCKLGEQHQNNYVQHFLPRLIKFLPTINPYTQNCSEYFTAVIQLYKQNNTGINGEELLQTLIKLIDRHPIIEADGALLQDFVLIGILELLTSLLSANPNLNNTLDQSVIDQIFFSCLFEIPTPQKHGRHAPPKCKTKESRRAAFNLLSVLSKGDKNNLEILKLVEANHLGVINRFTKWNYSPSSDQISPVGYVGLKNLGCICYMNSLLQQLFMMPKFRRAILSLDDQEDTKENPIADNLIYQLQTMYSYLQESQKQFFNPIDFCKANKDYDGKPTDVSVQMDVDEFFNMLCEKVESSLKGTKQEKLLNSIWSCDVVTQLICRECNYISERSEPSFTVSLDIKNKNNIQEALELYVQGEMLEGDNAYMCTKCDKKVDALMRRCIKTLPSTVIIHLKRFEFNFDTMRKMKLNDYCEFPMELSLEPYTKEGLARKENEQAIKDGKEVPNTLIEEHPQEYYQYRLVGILVHRGVSDSGHYYSFIKQRGTKNPQWLEFNDEVVSQFDVENIGAECFGGTENVSSVLQERSMNTRGGMWSQIVKSRNAYMLIYERNEEIPSQINEEVDENLGKEIIKKVKSKKGEENFEVLLPSKLYEDVWKENVNFLLGKKVFDMEYFNFIYQSLEDEIPENLELKQLDPSHFYSLKVVLSFVLEILSHSKDKEYLPKICSLLKQRLSQNIPACLWFLETFSKTYSKQILLECIVKDVRVEICQLISHVFREISKLHDGSNITDILSSDDKLVIILRGSLEQIINVWHILPFYWKNFSQYFQVLRDFARFSPIARQYLIEKQIPARIIKLISDANAKPEDLQKNKIYKMGDKFESVNLSNAVGLLAVLVRGSIYDFPEPSGEGRSVSVENNPFALEGPQINLPNDVLLAIRDQVFLSYCVIDKNNSRPINLILSYWSYENRVNTQWVCEFLCKGINSSEHDSLPPWFAVLTPYLNDLKDSLANDRVVKILETISIIFEKFKKYPKYTQSLVTNLYELYRESSVVRDYYDNNRSKAIVMEKWMESKFPSFPGFNMKKGLGNMMNYNDAGHIAGISSGKYSAQQTMNNRRREL